MKKTIVSLSLLALVSASSAFAGSDEHCKEMFKMADKNNDSMISEEEFMMEKRDMFKKIDKNSDGKLSMDEHKDAMMKMKEKMDD